MNSLLLCLAVLLADPTPPEGVLPTGSDGKPLNLDFESGTLKDWTATGTAFEGQPIKGDTVHPRRADNKSEHQGQYWIGGYEKLGDKPQGTLTSVPFTVTHPWASFLVGGGPNPETAVELLLLPKQEVIYRFNGLEEENLKRVAVDLQKVQGKQIQIRIVDRHSGHWGHINFDDFRFHADKPTVPQRPVPPVDPYPFAGQDPRDAAKNMTVPEGFSVKLFAAEPDLHQPIAMCTDDRGRLWVIEAFVYPRRKPEKGPILQDKKLGDKILILEDVDGDGTFDKKTVFFEGLNLASGIEYGFGGVWVGAAPYFLFIPILDGDKAGEPKILLDGWGYQDTHETLNSFIWGPDGWLYGCHGVFTHSRVGKPGTPEAERVPINAGIWRYHPTKHTFEVFAHGTSNPWGLDYNANGDFFIEACVIPHLWHIVQGGRYQRQAGRHFNPFTYTEIATIAKHRHYVGNQWNNTDRLKSDDLGGGHAHSGLICYQGGLWPKQYHGKLFMGNIHGHRLNVDEVTPKGASYVGDRNPDFLLTHDKHCIIVALQAAPDGNVYFSDWSDKQVCHRNEPEIWDRTNGRIFKIVHKNTKPVKNLDLQKLTNKELVELQTSDNEWMARHARRILQERAPQFGADGNNLGDVQELCAKILKNDPSERNRLRAVWTLMVTGAATSDSRLDTMKDSSVQVQAWGLLQNLEKSPVPFDYVLAASRSDSPVLRRTVASLLPNYPYLRRIELLEALLSRAEDATDHVLSQLYWYSLEPLLEKYPHLLSDLGLKAKLPGILELMTRRVGAIGTEMALNEIVAALGRTDNVTAQKALLDGFTAALKGTVGNKAPRDWSIAYLKLEKSTDPMIRQQALALGLKFGNYHAQKVFRDILEDKKADRAARMNALALLLENKDGGLSRVIAELLPDVTDPEFRGAMIRAASAYTDDRIPSTIVPLYAKLTPSEKRDAIATLASRVIYAEKLFEAVRDKIIPASDIPAETIRQLRNLGDKALSAKIGTVWGTVRDTPEDRKKLIAGWATKLKTPFEADLAAGRAVFNKACAQCHMLYGTGGKVGPEITGANRSDVNYLLENIFDPSAVIPKEYMATKLDLEDGRVITGIVKEDGGSTLTVITANETLTIPAADVAKRTPSPLSMMPEDLTKPFSETDVKHLIAYLRHPQQVPMKATDDNVKDFFNGKDLTGWDADPTATELKVWSVQNGEIVGKTAVGLKRNTFLTSQLEVSDFRLSVKVKLVPNTENSGIQFRSIRIEGGEMRGPQADMGKGWWGKLYEESARGMLVKTDNEKLVKPEEYNDYVIEAKGSTVKMYLNGNLTAELTDDKLAKKGLIGLQVHSGGPMEVRFKDLKLEVLK